MKNNVQGPCLPHCYKDEKLIYLIIGFILGVLTLAVVNRIMVKIPEGEQRKHIFPSTS